jgi:hypothetical protein
MKDIHKTLFDLHLLIGAAVYRTLILDGHILGMAHPRWLSFVLARPPLLLHGPRFSLKALTRICVHSLPYLSRGLPQLGLLALLEENQGKRLGGELETDESCKGSKQFACIHGIDILNEIINMPVDV